MQGWRKNYARYRAFFLDIYRVYRKRTDLKMYLEILLSLSTISIFALLALRPTALTITQLLEEVRSKEKVLATMDQKIKDLATARSNLDRELSRVEILNQAIPDRPSPEIFARQIQGYALRDGVTLGNFVMGDVNLVGAPNTSTSGKTDYESLPEGASSVTFSINASGSYENLVSFTTDLENLRRIAKVDYAIMNIAQGTGEKILTISITGRIPYYVRNDESK